MTHGFPFFDLVWTLVLRELRGRYRRSTLGFVWTMLQPLLTMGVLSVVFSSVFRFEIDRFPVYALTGILFWNFISQTVVQSMNSLRNNVHLIGHMPVPLAVFPVAATIAGVINLVLAILPLLLLVGLQGYSIGPALLIVPVPIVLAALFALGVGFLLAPLAAFFTDVGEMVGVLLTLLMYLTPIFYPIAIVPERYRWFVEMNPVRHLLDVFREPIYSGSFASLRSTAIAVGVSGLAVVAGYLVFKRSEGRVRYFL